MSKNEGEYRTYVCIRDCDDGHKNYTNDTIYKYKMGEVYGYYYTPQFPLQRNSFYTEEKNRTNLNTCGGYRGMATSSFVDANFILLSEYNNSLKEVDILFETYMKL